MKAKIYGLIDPRTDAITYVGKTILSLNRRLSLHLTNVTMGNSKKDKWIRELLQFGIKPQIILLDEVLNYEANSKEREWIHKLNHSLVNGNSGGGGNNGKGFKRNQSYKHNFRVLMNASQYSKNTIKNYICYVNKFIDSFHHEVKAPKDIYANEIENYLRSIVNRNTRNSTIVALKIFYKIIVKQPFKLATIKYEYK